MFQHLLHKCCHTSGLRITWWPARSWFLLRDDDNPFQLVFSMRIFMCICWYICRTSRFKSPTRCTAFYDVLFAWHCWSLVNLPCCEHHHQFCCSTRNSCPCSTPNLRFFNLYTVHSFQGFTSRFSEILTFFGGWKDPKNLPLLSILGHFDRSRSVLIVCFFFQTQGLPLISDPSRSNTPCLTKFFSWCLRVFSLHRLKIPPTRSNNNKALSK